MHARLGKRTEGGLNEDQCCLGHAVTSMVERTGHCYFLLACVEWTRGGVSVTSTMGGWEELVIAISFRPAWSGQGVVFQQHIHVLTTCGDT